MFNSLFGFGKGTPKEDHDTILRMIEQGTFNPLKIEDRELMYDVVARPELEYGIPFNQLFARMIDAGYISNYVIMKILFALIEPSNPNSKYDDSIMVRELKKRNGDLDNYPSPDPKMYAGVMVSNWRLHYENPNPQYNFDKNAFKKFLKSKNRDMQKLYEIFITEGLIADEDLKDFTLEELEEILVEYVNDKESYKTEIEEIFGSAYEKQMKPYFGDEYSIRKSFKRHKEMKDKKLKNKSSYGMSRNHYHTYESDDDGW